MRLSPCMQPVRPPIITNRQAPRTMTFQISCLILTQVPPSVQLRLGRQCLTRKRAHLCLHNQFQSTPMFRKLLAGSPQMLRTMIMTPKGQPKGQPWKVPICRLKWSQASLSRCLAQRQQHLVQLSMAPARPSIITKPVRIKPALLRWECE